MADFAAQLIEISFDQLAPHSPGAQLVLEPSTGGATVVYAQVVEDSTAGLCYWQSDTLTSTPASGITTPNHTNNLVAGEWTVLGRVD